MTRRLVNIMDMPDPTDISESGIEAALLPCPFCGGEAHSVGYGPYHVICKACGARTTTAYTMPEKGAVELWNRRHPPASREEGLREAAECVARLLNTWEAQERIFAGDASDTITSAILALIPTKPEAGESHEDYVKRLILGPKTYEDGLSDARTIVRRGIDSLDGGVDAASRRYDAAIAALQSKKPE